MSVKFLQLGLGLIFFLPSYSEGIYVKTNSALNRGWSSPANPVFESTLLGITVSPGETAQLPCKVKNLGDKVVSWIRSKDLHIISSSVFMFTGDSRFQIIHPEDEPDSWSLQIRNVKFEDEGQYECQVNTDPKMKQAVVLSVTDGTEGTIILGHQERFVKIGSRLTLTCHSRAVDFYHLKGQRPVRLVDWLHNDNIIIFDHSRSGVSVDTEKDGRDLSSQLTLASVSLADSGKYTCKPYNSDPYSIVLIVVEGERTEAMQSDAPASANTIPLSFTALSLFLIFLLST